MAVSTPPGRWSGLSDEDADQRVQDALDAAKEALSYAHDAMERVDELEQEVHELRQENQRLRDQKSIFEDVRQNMQSDPEQRGVRLIKTLNNRALTNQQVGKEPKATMTRDEVDSALQGEYRGQQLHDAMNEAERLVGDKDVLWKRTGDPGRGGRDTKLHLDLTQGDLPTTIAGERIRQQPYGRADE